MSSDVVVEEQYSRTGTLYVYSSLVMMIRGHEGCMFVDLILPLQNYHKQVTTASSIAVLGTRPSLIR
jgi:hypothetical protein